VETTEYFLNCMRYIELNPVRARIVQHPAEYEWSSYGQNIAGAPTGLVTAHAEYLRLGRDDERRGAAYAALFDEPLDDRKVEVIRLGISQGKAVGSETFCKGLQQLTGRAVTFVPRGRPARRDLSPFS
jgi:putative transposase